jgi:hypothetical protein
VIELALVTGIPPGVWAEEGARSIATAIELMEERSRPASTTGQSDGVQYSG